jgi:hypothetical protein
MQPGLAGRAGTHSRACHGPGVQCVPPPQRSSTAALRALVRPPPFSSLPPAAGQTQSLYVLTKSGGQRFEFIFTNVAGADSDGLFAALQAVHRAYDGSRLFRDLKLRGGRTSLDGARGAADRHCRRGWQTPPVQAGGAGPALGPGLPPGSAGQPCASWPAAHAQQPDSVAKASCCGGVLCPAGGGSALSWRHQLGHYLARAHGALSWRPKQ